MSLSLLKHNCNKKARNHYLIFPYAIALKTHLKYNLGVMCLAVPSVNHTDLLTCCDKIRVIPQVIFCTISMLLT